MTFFGVGLLPNVNQCIFSMGLELNHLPVYHLLYSANTYTLIHAHTRHMCCVLSDDDNRISLRPLPGHSDCQREYINASYVDVR